MFGIGKRSSCARIDTVIGEQTRIEGDLHFTGGLHVDGTIKGNIIAESGAENVLTVSERGRIQGDVQVPNLVLNGSVEGDVTATERVELASHARVTGNVYYNLIEMAMGAEVNGSLVHRRSDRREAAVVEDQQSLEDAGMPAVK